MKKNFVVLFALFVTFTLLGLGCSGGGDSVEECDCEPSISFVSPTGSSLTEFNDKDNNPDNGIQYAVQVNTHCIPNGTELTLTLGGNTQTAVVAVQTQGGMDGIADFGEATFGEGSNSACVSHEGFPVTWMADGTTSCKNNDQSIEQCKSVQVTLGSPTCRFENPQDGETLSSEDDSASAWGFQHDVELLCTGVNANEIMSLVVGDNPAIEATMTSVNSRMTEVVFSNVTFSEGTNLLTATTEAQNGSTIEVQIGVTVTTGSCVVRLLPENNSIFRLVDDADDQTAGLQIKFTVESDTSGAFACVEGSEVSIFQVDDENTALGTGTLTNGAADILVDMTDGQLSLFAQVVEAGGGKQGRSAIQTYQACVTPLSVKIQPSLDGLTIQDSADQDANTPGVQITVAGTSKGVAEKTNLTLECTGDVEGTCSVSPEPTQFTANGGYQFTVTFADTGNYTIQAKGTNACGEETQSAVQLVYVITEQWVCWIEDPQEAAKLNQTDDLDQDLDGLQYAVLVKTSESVPDGQAFSLKITGQTEVTGVIQNDSWTGQVTFEDSTSKILQCDLANYEDNQAKRTIRVDNTPPTIEITSPLTEAVMEEATLDVCVTTTGVEQAEQGWDPVVTVTVSDNVDQSADYVCSLTENSICCNVTLLEGTNYISAQVADQVGNTAQDQIEITNFIFDNPPLVSFVDPQNGNEIPTPGPYDIKVQVQDILQTAFQDKIALTVSRDGSLIKTLVPSSYSNEVATFTNTFSSLGLLTLEACAVNNHQDSPTCESIQVQVGPVGAPTITITSPTNGSCTQEAAATLTAQVTNSEGYTCHFCVQTTPLADPPECEPTHASFKTSGITNAEGICTGDQEATLSSEGSYFIWASIDNDISTDTFSISLDRDLTDPTINFVAPTTDQLLGVDSSLATIGFQIAVTISADVRDGITPTYLHLDQADAVVNGESPTFSNQQLTFTKVNAAHGSHTLETEVCDACGNCSTGSVNFSVDNLHPSVEIVDPTNGAGFGIGEDLTLDPGFQYAVVTTIQNAQVGDTICLERRLAGGSWEPTGTANCHVLTASELSGFTFSNADNATLLTGDQGDVEIRATISDGFDSDSYTVSININLIAPTVTITRPDDGSVFNFLSDTDHNKPGVQVQVNIETDNTEPGNELGVCVCNENESCLDEQSGDLCMKNGKGTLVFENVVTGSITIAYADLVDGNSTITAYARNPNLIFSNPISVSTDSVPPVVDSLGIINDDGNSCLSIAEGAMQLSVTVQDPDGNSLEGRTIRLRQGGLSGTVLASSVIASNQALLTATIPDSATLQDFTVTFSDAAGNPNLRDVEPIILNPSAKFQARADTVAPGINISAPNQTNLNFALDANQLTEDFDFSFCATTTGVIDGQSVTFSIDTVQQGQQTIASGTACLTTSMGQGSHTLQATVADACGNPAPPASRTVSVDTILPTIRCTGPTTGVYTSDTLDFTCTTGGTDGGGEILVLSNKGDECYHTVSGSGEVTFQCTLAEDIHELSVTVTDTAGNDSAPFDIAAIEIDLPGCPIAISGYVGQIYFKQTDDLDGTAGLQIQVQACSASCTSATCSLPNCFVTLDIVGDGPVGDAQGLDGAGCVTFDVTLPDNTQNKTILVTMNDEGDIATDSFVAKLVDLVPPDLTRSAPGADSVVCVSATENPNVNGTTILADINDATLDNCEMDFQFIAEEDKASATFPATLTLYEDAIPIAGPTTITSTDPQTIDYLNIALSHTAEFHNGIQAVLTDAAGNQTTIDLAVQVDIQPPEEVSNVQPPLITNNRRANISLAWSGVGDDGASGSASGYVIRWSRDPITNQSEWDAAIELYSDTDISTSVIVPPLNTYHFAVRAYDDLGNLGPVPTADTNTENLWTMTTYTSDFGASYWMGYYVWNLGNIDHDLAGTDDLLVAAPWYTDTFSNEGRTFLFYGTSNLADWSSDTYSPVELSASIAAGGEYFGWDATVGNIADAALPEEDPQNYPDLIIGGYGYNGGQGRIAIYFGQNGPLPTSPSVEIRGTAGSGFGKSCEVIGDINNDGLADLFVSAPTEATFGRGYIFFGKSEDDWRDLAGVDGYIVIDEPGAVDIAFQGENVEDTDEWFGYRHGATGLGDMNNDGYDDFALVASAVNQLYTFDGQTIAGATGDVSPLTDSEDVISYGTVLDSGFKAGFGTRTIGTLDFTYDTGSYKDLIVTDSFAGSIYLFEGTDSKITPTYTTKTSLAGCRFGYDVDSLDINKDGLRDIIVGSNNNLCKRAYVMYNQGDLGFLSQQPESILEEATGDGFFGMSVTAGDFNGDGDPDIVVASPKDESGDTPVDRFYVYY